MVMSGWVRIGVGDVYLGEYGTGTIIGEEWLYSKTFQKRQFQAWCPKEEDMPDSRTSKTTLLEITLHNFLQIRLHLMKPTMFRKYFKGQRELTDKEFESCCVELKKDSRMFEAQIKRNYFVKKICMNKLKLN